MGLNDLDEIKKKTTKMSPQQQKSGSSGLIAAGALAAAGAGVGDYHKDMGQGELREAGDSYLAKTKEVSVSAYEGAKPYVMIAAGKTAEASKVAYAKLMDLYYGEAGAVEEAIEEPASESFEAEEDIVVQDEVSEATEETFEAPEAQEEL